MIDYKKGLKVSSYIVPSSSKDSYPTHIDEFGAGGYRTVNTMADLALIPGARSKIGMLAYVLESNEIYILTSSGWNKWLSYDNLDLSLEDIKLDIIDLRYDTQRLVSKYDKDGYRIVDTLIARDAIASDRRRLGMLVYVIETSTIYILSKTLDNAGWLSYLPPLKIVNNIPLVNTEVPTEWIGAVPLLSGGQTYRATADGNIEASNALVELEESIKLYLLWRGTTHFICGSGSTVLKNLFMRNTQWLDDLDDPLLPDKFHILKSNKGVISKALSGEDYVNTQEQADDSYVSLIQALPLDGVDNVKFISRSSIRVLQGLAENAEDDVRGINSLSVNSLQAKLTVSSDDDVIARNALKSRKIIFYDYNPVNSYTKFIALEAPQVLVDSVTWVAPRTGVNKQILTLQNNNEWTFSDIKDVDIASKNATYITQTKNESLPNSQALNSLVGGGILKTTALSNGAISIASGGKVPVVNDYVLPNDLVTEIELVEGQIQAVRIQIAGIQAQIAGLIEALEEIIGIGVGTTLANFALNITNLVQGIATAKDLRNLKADTVHLNNTYKDKINVFFDNKAIGAREEWSSGLNILATDTSWTDTFSNDIHPIYLKLGGYYHAFAGVGETGNAVDAFAFRTDFYNKGSNKEKWLSKRIVLCHHFDNLAGAGGKDVDLLEYDRGGGFIFHKPIEKATATKINITEQLAIPVYVAGTAPVESFGNGAIWVEY